MHFFHGIKGESVEDVSWGPQKSSWHSDYPHTKVYLRTCDRPKAHWDVRGTRMNWVWFEVRKKKTRERSLLTRAIWVTAESRSRIAFRFRALWVPFKGEKRLPSVSLKKCHLKKCHPNDPRTRYVFACHQIRLTKVLLRCTIVAFSVYLVSLERLQRWVVSDKRSEFDSDIFFSHSIQRYKKTKHAAKKKWHWKTTTLLIWDTSGIFPKSPVCKRNGYFFWLPGVRRVHVKIGS